MINNREKLILILSSILVFSFSLIMIAHNLLISDGRFQALILSIPFLAQFIYFYLCNHFSKFNNFLKLSKQVNFVYSLFINIFLYFFFLFLIKYIQAQLDPDDFIASGVMLKYSNKLNYFFIFISLIFSSLSSFLYAHLLNSYFDKTENKSQIYFYEIFGFTLAGIFIPFLIDHFPAYIFWIFFCLISICTNYLLGFEYGPYNKRPLIITSCLIIIATLTQHFLNQDDNFTARNGKLRQQNINKILVSDWTTYGKLQLVQSGEDQNYIAIGNHSRALIPSKTNIENILNSNQIKTLSSQNFTKILVLYAGGGVEVEAFKNLYPNAKVIGVEINPKIIKLSSSDKKDYIVNSDVRKFLQNTSEKFDLIYSAQNGVQSYYLNSTQYTQTKEAYDEYLTHLEENGTLLIASLTPETLLTLHEAIKNLETKITSNKSIQLFIVKKSGLNFRALNPHYLIYSPLTFPTKNFDVNIKQILFSKNEFNKFNDYDFYEKNYLHIFRGFKGDELPKIMTDNSPFRSAEYDSITKNLIIFSLISIIGILISIRKKYISPSLKAGFLATGICFIFQFILLKNFANPTHVLIISSLISSLAILVSYFIEFKIQSLYRFIILIILSFFSIFQITQHNYINTTLIIFFLFCFLTINSKLFLEQLKNKNDFIANWQWNLLACSLGVFIAFKIFELYGMKISLIYFSLIALI